MSLRAFKNKLIVPYIGWEIKSNCNMNCHFCYASSWNRNLQNKSNTPDPSQSDIVKGLEYLIKAGLGIRYVNWTGGEILLRANELNNILKSSSNLGLTNIISTNGMFSPIFESREIFLEFLWQINTNLSWLSISLDSEDEDLNNSLRINVNGSVSSFHFSDVMHIIDIHKSNSFSFNLKINTLVNSKNKNRIMGIADILRNNHCSWKLIQFNPRECVIKFRKEYYINQAEFMKIYYDVLSYNNSLKPPSKIALSYRLYDGSIEPYCVLVINASGEILLPKGEQHIVLANLLNYVNNDIPPIHFKENLISKLEETFQNTSYMRKAGNNIKKLLESFTLSNLAIYNTAYSI